jgi:hypothetical protein
MLHAGPQVGVGEAVGVPAVVSVAVGTGGVGVGELVYGAKRMISS